VSAADAVPVPPGGWRPFVVMASLVAGLMLVFALAGCKHGPRLDKALDGIETGAVAVDIVLDEQVDAWAEFVDAQVEHCGAELDAGHISTRAELDDCLGPAAHADKVRQFLEIAVDLQRSIADAVPRLRELEAEISDLAGPVLEK